jgi:hypothetical protein
MKFLRAFAMPGRRRGAAMTIAEIRKLIPVLPWNPLLVSELEKALLKGAKELIVDGGETLDGSARKLKLNDTPDETCITISTPAGIVAVLDRHQQQRMYLYLQERLQRT